ncbi:MFS transporter [Micromonospora craniellae]|uniref:MFS transporter n=1 Tax=Micromonospora craniellae TaxID=2294034 RepID=A0A372FSG2_9ACTN|nr:MFS transporter [Micromonospora craniellae]QOC94745.1 MFS transporter [Micromonospora craniellae]RFS43722.1 MFS transporter [Micromonospora craniellae]
MLNVKPYRDTLALPGLRPLLLVAILARVPVAATAVAMTLYVLDLGRGFFAAGLVGAAMTVGSALGAPLLGRLVDRRGLRPMLLLTTAVSALFWGTAPVLPYPVLLGAALVGGLLTLPVFSVVRQSIAALVPPTRRRQAYALDSMSVELSFMIGPAAAVALSTSVSPTLTLYAVGGGIVLAGLTLLVLNPPTRAQDEVTTPAQPLPRKEWLTPRLIGLLAGGAAGTLVIAGTEVAVVAVLRDAGQVEWTGVVLALWASYSLVGGFTYGTLSRPVPSLILALLLGMVTIPVGLGSGEWWLLALVLLPSGALTAPTIAATADAVSRLAPASVRGEAMGLHGSAMVVGVALGTPLAGAAIDASAPAWGFAATGLLGALIALAMLPAELRHRRSDDAQVNLTDTASPPHDPASTRASVQG